VSEGIQAAFIDALCRVAVQLGRDARAGGLELARRFGLEGLAVRHGLGDPDDDRLRGAARARRFYEEVLLEAAHDVSAALAAAEVPHAFVRGATLIGSCYHPGDRELADLDVHLVPAHARTALDVLQTEGLLPLPLAQQSGPPALRPGLVLERAAPGTELTTVTVDLHWGFEAVERLLPRSGPDLPPDWLERLETANGLPCPTDEDHLAILVHHVVHHDLLHVRGLLDFALLVDRVGGAGGARFVAAAEALGVGRAARHIHAIAVRDLGAEPLPRAIPPARSRRDRRAAALVGLDAWLAIAAEANLREAAEVTRRRVRRRSVLADGRMTWARLAVDALWPPADFLRWRWPGMAWPAARLRHLGRAARKLLAR